MPLGDCALKSRYEQAFPDKSAYYDVHLAPEKSSMQRIMNRCYYIALSILSLGLLPLFSPAFREAMHWTWHHKMTLALKPFEKFTNYPAFVQKMWFNLAGPRAVNKPVAPSKWVPSLEVIPETGLPYQELAAQRALAQKMWCNLEGPPATDKPVAPLKWAPNLTVVVEKGIPIEPYVTSVPLHTRHETSLGVVAEEEEQEDELTPPPIRMRMAAPPAGDEADEISSVGSDDILMSDVEDGETTVLNKILDAAWAFFSRKKSKTN